MADEGGMDPCECIFSHQLAMRRLLRLLRQSQDSCSDTECYNYGSPEDSASSNTQFMMILCWMAIAFMLYMFRPPSLRMSTEGKKPRGNEPGGEDDRPPTSPNAF